ncbi:O-antigen translocase [Flavobacterium sp. SUN052]|uniref:O-antigen translocase n=1 Tax=Flavobacterium sp. SUN052 TaxID=3002441 RepID=UPI00237DD325|nr:O-antigen translocase [Flavobacterium sp. SUN052]MEC4005407.1 O-antigen translocase [Flavobacterium sp. SUN052]
MSFIKEILSKPLFKATSLNGISILLKICIGFITSKFIAVFVGPSGMALVGNLRNFLSSTEAISTLGFENGVVKYVAEKKDNSEGLQKIISTVFVTIALLSCFLGVVLFLFSYNFNCSVFGINYHYNFVFKALALALPWYVGNIFLTAIINGLGNYKKVIYINAIGSCIGLFITVFLIWKFQINGAFLAVILTPTVLFAVSFGMINSEIRILNHISWNSFDFSILKKLSSFSLMVLVSSVFGPMVFLAIRNTIIEDIGVEQAGFWEAITRISSYYMLFVTTILMIYFLPKLAASKDNLETKSIFFSYYKGIIPVFLLGLISIYFLKKFIINILFTAAFQPLSQLFLWQLIGDFLKALALILGINFYAKNLTKAFIVTELVSLMILYFSSLFFLAKYGIEGVVIAHAFTYAVYLLVLSIYFRKSLFVKTNEKA